MRKTLSAALLLLLLTVLPSAALAAEHIHNFQAVSDDPYDDFICTGCDGAVTPDMKEAYDALRELDGKILPQDVQQTEEAIAAYLEGEVTGTLDTLGWFMSTVDRIRYDEPQAGVPGSYVYTVNFQSFGRTTLLGNVDTGPLTLVIPAAEEEAPVTYSIAVYQAPFGDVSVNTRYAEPGETVTVHVYAYYGYTLRRLTATSDNGEALRLHPIGDGRYLLSMPASGVTVEAVFGELERPAEEQEPGIPETPEEPQVIPEVPEEEPAAPVLNLLPMPFADVDSSAWYYDGVDYAWKHVLMTGVSATSFAPQETVSRAMVWTVLARMNGVSVDPIPGTVWYTPGLVWAIGQEVSDGTSPSAAVTREQLAAMLWRNAGSPGASADLNGFADSGSISGYALDAVRWAVANGILKGADGCLLPKGNASRAEMAVLLSRLPE